MAFHETEALLVPYWQQVVQKYKFQGTEGFHASAGLCVETSHMMANLIAGDFEEVSAVSGIVYGQLIEINPLRPATVRDHSVLLVDNFLVDLTRGQHVGMTPSIWSLDDPAVAILETKSHAQLRSVMDKSFETLDFATALRKPNMLGRMTSFEPILEAISPAYREDLKSTFLGELSAAIEALPTSGPRL